MGCARSNNLGRKHRVRTLSILALAAFAMLPCARARPDDSLWAPAPVQEAEPALQDLELTLRVRQAMAKDPALASLNLFVSVHGRVATLRGRVASQTVIASAKSRLQRVRGLTEVRVELRDDLPENPAKAPRPVQQLVPYAEPTPSAAPRIQEAIARRTSDDGWTPSATLGRPTSREVPVQTTAPPVRVQTLQELIEVRRLSDQRFLGIRVELTDGVVNLKGKVYRWEHVAEFARSIALLPGVKRVTLDQVEAEVSR
jgi:hypothetical protein